MKLQIERRHFKDGYTIGDLFIDGKFFCNTLEDFNRDKNKDGDLLDPGEEKVYGKTAIPFGKYTIEITFSQKFNRELPLIKNVPGFGGVRIHPGNTAEDTEGCILVGKNNQVGRVNESKYHFDLLFAQMKESGQTTFELEII